MASLFVARHHPALHVLAVIVLAMMVVLLSLAARTHRPSRHYDPYASPATQPKL